MTRLLPIMAASALAAIALVAVAAAQDAAPDLDLAAIRARAQDHAADAEALATTVRRKADALADDAQATRQTAITARAAYRPEPAPKAPAGPLDFDGIIRDQAEAESTAIGETPRFIAFASLAMPDAALKALVRDVARAGGVTVLRGFPAGGADVFRARLAALWSDQDEAGALGIDPRLFRAFHVDAAPSFVMVAGDFSPCDGFACTDTLPPHDRMAGNITVHEVLDTFAEGGGPGAALARVHLKRLEENQP